MQCLASCISRFAIICLIFSKGFLGKVWLQTGTVERGKSSRHGEDSTPCSSLARRNHNHGTSKAVTEECERAQAPLPVRCSVLDRGTLEERGIMVDAGLSLTA